MSNTEANSIIQIVQYFNSNSELLNDYNSGKQFDIADPNSVIYLLNNIFADTLYRFPLLLDKVFNILKTNKPPLMMQIAEHYKTDLDKNKLEAVMQVIQQELIPYYTQNKELITNLSSAQKPPAQKPPAQKPPADVAIDFFNDPAIAKPAPATTALSAATAAPTAAPVTAAPVTAAPVKDKYGLINKLVTGTGTAAAELAAVNVVKQTLIEAAAGDTSHDFDDKKAISGITNLINTTYKDFYFNGLPGVTNLRNIQSEEQTIASVIEANSYKFIRGTVGGEGATFGTNVNGASFNGVPYSPLTAMKFIKDGMVDGNIATNNDRTGKPIVQPDKCTHEFKTVTGNDYICTYFDVKPETGGKKGEIIDAEQFFKKMGFRDEDNFNIGLIVDCVSITLEDIFNKGTKLPSGKQVRLVKSSEGENDPGGKTNINDKTFKTFAGGTFSSGTGIDYKAAIPLNIDKNKKYTYYYDATQKTPYAWFLNHDFCLRQYRGNLS